MCVNLSISSMYLISPFPAQKRAKSLKQIQWPSYNKVFHDHRKYNGNKFQTILTGCGLITCRGETDSLLVVCKLGRHIRLMPLLHGAIVSLQIANLVADLGKLSWR